MIQSLRRLDTPEDQPYYDQFILLVWRDGCWHVHTHRIRQTGKIDLIHPTIQHALRWTHWITAPWRIINMDTKQVVKEKKA